MKRQKKEKGNGKTFRLKNYHFFTQGKGLGLDLFRFCHISFSLFAFLFFKDFCFAFFLVNYIWFCARVGGYHHCYFFKMFFILIYFLLLHFFCKYRSFLLLLYIHFCSCVIVGIKLIHLVFLQLDVFFTWLQCLPCEKARPTYVKSLNF